MSSIGRAVASAASTDRQQRRERAEATGDDQEINGERDGECPHRRPALYQQRELRTDACGREQHPAEDRVRLPPRREIDRREERAQEERAVGVRVRDRRDEAAADEPRGRVLAGDEAGDGDQAESCNADGVPAEKRCRDPPVPAVRDEQGEDAEVEKRLVGTRATRPPGGRPRGSTGSSSRETAEGGERDENGSRRSVRSGDEDASPRAGRAGTAPRGAISDGSKPPSRAAQKMNTANAIAPAPAAGLSRTARTHGSSASRATRER